MLSKFKNNQKRINKNEFLTAYISLKTTKKNKKKEK